MKISSVKEALEVAKVDGSALVVMLDSSVFVH